MKTIKINIAKDFTETPGGRKKESGDFSGEEFREKFLEPHFQDKDSKYRIEINMDGGYGYAASWIDEVFGDLTAKFGKSAIMGRLRIISDEDFRFL